MRDRHFPRLCRTCTAPMARQENTCWSCGSRWETTFREPVEEPRPTRVGLPLNVRRGAAAHALTDIDRWVDEGGRVGAEPVAGRT